MDQQQKLYNEETLGLLRDIAKAIARQETKVNVEAPNVTVEPTPVVVQENQVSLDTSDLKSALEAVVEGQKDLKTVKVANFKTIDKVSIKNLGEMEKLLRELIKKETTINVDTKAPQVSVSFPTSQSPKDYIPVRLTDGVDFYNSISGLAQVVKSGGMSAKAQANLEALQFDLTGNLKTTAVITGDVIVDNVGIENVAGDKINPATEETLSGMKTNMEKGFGAEDDLTITDVTVGDIETIITTNGIITKTVVINDATGGITVTWS